MVERSRARIRADVVHDRLRAMGFAGNERTTRRAVVMELPIRLRVIVLREFEGMTYRTIAEVPDIPVGTVMSRLHAARARLRRQLS